MKLLNSLLKELRVPLLVLFMATAFWACRQDKELLDSGSDNSPEPPRSARLYVILGSSTAAGVGAGVYDSSWVGRSFAYLRKNVRFKGDSIINLARSGYTTNDIMPSGDKNRNITKALSFKPYAVIVNMPSNDIAKGGTVESQMKNFAAIAELARQQKVVLWVTTSQPRNLDEAGRKKLIELKDQIVNTYGKQAIDFWTDIANANGTINSMYNAGDGIHINSDGHRIFFTRVVAKKVFE